MSFWAIDMEFDNVTILIVTFTFFLSYTIFAVVFLTGTTMEYFVTVPIVLHFSTAFVTLVIFHAVI